MKNTDKTYINISRNYIFLTRVDTITQELLNGVTWNFYTIYSMNIIFTRTGNKVIYFLYLFLTCVCVIKNWK